MESYSEPSQRWREVIQRIRIKEALIHPDFRGIVESVEAKKDLKALWYAGREYAFLQRCHSAVQF